MPKKARRRKPPEIIRFAFVRRAGPGAERRKWHIIAIAGPYLDVWTLCGERISKSRLQVALHPKDACCFMSMPNDEVRELEPGEELDTCKRCLARLEEYADAMLRALNYGGWWSFRRDEEGEK